MQTKPFVWVAKSEGDELVAKRIDVKLEQSGGEYTSVLSGLQVDDQVVVNGYQYLKDDAKITAQSTPAQSSTPARSSTPAQKAKVAITEKGYEPASIELKAGTPAEVTFTRKTDATCGTEIVIPEYSVKEKLPLNKPVTVKFTPKKSGEFKFTCGMDMLRGKVVVK